MRLHSFVVPALLLCVTPVCIGGSRAKASAPAPGSSTYVITNDDAGVVFDENTISYFLAGGSPSAPSLTYQNSVEVGGVGGGGGNFGAASIVTQPSSNAPCLYVSNAGSGQIGAVNIQSQQLAGVFTGS